MPARQRATRGACDRRLHIRRDQLEAGVLNALHNRMLDPEISAEFCNACAAETNRLRMESPASMDAARSETERTDRTAQKLMDLYRNGALWVEDRECGDKLRACKTELTWFLATADEPCSFCIPQWPDDTGFWSSRSTKRSRQFRGEACGDGRRPAARWMTRSKSTPGASSLKSWYVTAQTKNPAG